MLNLLEKSGLDVLGTVDHGGVVYGIGAVQGERKTGPPPASDQPLESGIWGNLLFKTPELLPSG
jgi:hypothetical protein